MPPRIPVQNCLRARAGVPQPQTVTPLRSFSSSPSVQGKPKQKKVRAPYRSFRDVYAAEFRKKANLARQEALKKERAKIAGDPVKGITTPFLKSFDTGIPPRWNTTDAPYLREQERKQEDPVLQPEPDKNKIYLNHLTTRAQLDDVVSKMASQASLTGQEFRGVWQEHLDRVPLRRDMFESEEAYEAEKKRREEDRAPTEAARSKEIRNLILERANKEHNAAVESLERIMKLQGSNRQAVHHANVARCIDEFGRHSTDKILKPPPRQLNQIASPPVDKRGGPDTGSSEVQIAILSSKIRKLAMQDEAGKLKKNKAHKRNLRLLVHKRQKLLKYLLRKEKGGPRFQHVIDKLGITEAAWKGEITL